MQIRILRGYARRAVSGKLRAMPSTHLVRRVCAAPDDVFDIVADVENYPKFINLISALRITKQISPTDFEAEAIVAYKMLRENFRSHVHIDREKGLIKVSKAQAGGALKTLKNTWKFHALSDGSTAVDFYVDVSLKAFPLNMIVREKMGRASDVIMSAFERRAAQICKPVGLENLDMQAEYQRLGLEG